MSSRFHKELYRESSIRHDNLVLSCVSENGVERICTELGLDKIKQKRTIPPDSDGRKWLCGNDIVGYCKLEGAEISEGDRDCIRRKDKTKNDLVEGIFADFESEPSKKGGGGVVYCDFCDPDKLKNSASTRYHIKNFNANPLYYGELLTHARRMAPITELYNSVSNEATYETEKLMKTKSGFIIGYADILLCYKVKFVLLRAMTKETVIRGYPKTGYVVSYRVLVEAKPDLVSFGAVIRQIKTYRDCLGSIKNLKLVVATYTKPNESFLKLFENEGIKLIHFEE